MKKLVNKICIVGSGVIGLTTGIKLLQAGYVPQIIAEHLPPHTMSDIGAALWQPYHLKSSTLGFQWALESLKEFSKISKEANSGITWINLIEVYKHKHEKPKWMDYVKSVSAPFIPEQYPFHLSVEVPLIDTSIYMSYLTQQFTQLGGLISQRYLRSFHELEEYSFIINCAGMGARQLVLDDKIFPIKGQVLQLTKPKGLNFGISEHEEKMLYIYPRANDCIVGSTAEEQQWELEYTSKAIEELQKKAVALCPMLANEEIIGHKIGIRPSRHEVCLKFVTVDNKKVINNYGHGARGFTLSWGCAEEVLKLLEKHFS